MQPTIQIQGLSFNRYLDAAQVASEVQNMASLIAADYKDKSPVIIGVLNGAVVFTSDLIRAMDIPCEVTFIKANSYDGLNSFGDVSIQMASNLSIADRHVLLVEDIIDTGNTAAKLLVLLESHKPSSISLVALLHKPAALKHNLKPDYLGFEIPNIFVVGYGMDYKEQGRNLKDIYALH